MKNKRFIRAMLLTSLSLFGLSACSEDKTQTNQPQKQLPSVSVAQVINEPITEWDEFTGRLEAPEQVTLVPRVSGYINSVHFKEGALVKKGDILFQIDPSVFKSEVARLKAQLASANVAKELAANDFKRAYELYKKKAVSEELLDTRQANKNKTIAEVDSVKAALVKAQLDLSYTKVKAPISGRVSFADVTMGNYVTAGQSELTSLVSTAHMYAYFDVDEQTFLKYAKLTQEHKRNDQRNNNNPVFMALVNEIGFPNVGVIDFVDNVVNRTTGTIRVRARFANENGQLLPGLFTRIRLAGSGTYKGILIDDKAIGTDLSNKFVLVVNPDNQLVYRNIELGEKVQGLRIVKSGLQAEERIVVNGLQKVRAKMAIDPKMVPMASDANLLKLRKAQAVLDNAKNVLVTQRSTAASRS